jgi:superfamily II DNA or RNA helicase
MADFESLLSGLSADPNVRGDQFERICAWYLRSAPEYRRKFRQVSLWSEWPDAWAADAGIDLVAEEHDGNLWAIQAKAYDPTYAIKKSDVDSFLSESGRPEFSYRLLIATTDRLGARAKRTLDDQREPVGYLMRSQLEAAHVEWPSSPDDLRPRSPAPKKPLPHVREAITATCNALKTHERGQLIMACGTGKTLGAMWIAERLDATRTLVLLPSLSLLGQTLREWTANAAEPFQYLAVCSDKTVTGEEFVQHTAELGVPVTTDPTEIASFLRRRGRRVVFATYQSSPQVAASFSQRTPHFDLAVADEAHRCAGRVAGEFATILDAGQIKARRRLFMTATPRYYTPRLRREAGLADVEVASMDDEAVFGPVLHRLNFGEAIERRLLSDYQVVVVGVDDDTYRAYAERAELVTRDGERITDARTLAGQVGLAKTMRKYDLHRVISFHSRVSAATAFSREMPEVIAWMPAQARPAGTLWSQHVSGAMTSGHRDRLLLRFRNLRDGERGLLSNARCLGEGVDVPTLDGVAFIDPRRSTTDIIQAVGRAIRKAPDKKIGTIVLPVFISGQEDPDRLLDESQFKHVWDVLKALRAHDETLGEELDEIRRALGARRDAVRRPGKIKVDLPREVGFEFARAFDARLVEQTTASWEFWFGLLLRFVDQEGHGQVPNSYRDKDGFPLGSWVGNQRQARRRGELTDERTRRLAEVPGWAWFPNEDQWEDGYKRLLRFAEREGHSRVRARYRDNDGFALGAWVSGQRSRTNRPTMERIERLEALPGWAWDIHDADWENGFARLLLFADREGHSRVPDSYRDDDGFKLGSWVVRQRTLRGRGQLAEERTGRLEALPGWVWSVNEAAWEDRYARLLLFAEREGHSRVPHTYHEEDGFALGAWTHIQRRRGPGGLPEGRARRLEAVPGWVWSPHQASWEDGYTRLLRFSQREGHCRVPASYRDEDGFPLGTWVAKQRSTQSSGDLSNERSRRLEALPGWDREERFTWDDAYSRVRNFAEREGHSRVPDSYRDEDGLKLGGWVARQRRAARKGQLAAERARQLEELPGWAWFPHDAKWEDGYARLLRFAEREGHSRVPASYRDNDGVALGTWVVHKRKIRKQGRLAEDRVRLLEAVPGWEWEPPMGRREQDR